MRTLPTFRLLVLVGVCVLAACDAGGSTRTPLPTLAPTSAATTAPPTDLLTFGPSPSDAPWPPAWHDAFCAAYVDVVIAQQLARDVGRSLEADDRDNAIGLAHELQTTVSGVGDALTALPEWDGATQVRTALSEMLGFDDQLATFYLRYLEEGRDGALDKAHSAEDDLRNTAIPAVAAALQPLIAEGFVCAETPPDLESP